MFLFSLEDFPGRVILGGVVYSLIHCSIFMIQPVMKKVTKLCFSVFFKQINFHAQTLGKT